LAAISKNIDAAGFSLNEISVPVGIAAAVAIAWTGNSGGSHDGRAHIGVGLHGSADLINFINRQLTSAGTRQDSVVFLSRHTFSPFLFVTSARLPSSFVVDTQCLHQSRPKAVV
jgi:hypothetical protein